MKACLQCDKGSQMGGGYSNRVRAMEFNPVGKRRRYPNLQWARLADGRRVKLCTRCIKKGDYAHNKSL
ncbi:MAG: L28 family ribosomal protein [bacterium]|nr:L28 family ribosomal protein [bacterium]